MTTSMKALLGSAALALMATGATAETGACLITKTDTNPFFVKMKEGAEAKAAELGITLKSYAGKIDGDHESQVSAIEACIADGAKGILITASDTKAIVDSVKAARDAGLLVIARDTPLDPIDAADATFATDNFLAGELIGKWAAATLGAEYLLASGKGLGNTLIDGREHFWMDLVLWGVVVIGLVGYALNATLSALEKRLLAWRDRTLAQY